MLTKLTVALVKRAAEVEPPVADMNYFDTEVRRFALGVKRPSQPGARWAAWFFVKYTSPTKQARKIKVGNPHTMTLDAARQAAKQVLARVDAGGDPVADIAAARESWTVREAWAAYASSPEFQKKAPRSLIEDAAVARNHVLRHVGSVKLDAIDAPLVRRLIRSVEADTRKNNRKRKLGGPGAARRAVRCLSSLLTWSVNEGRATRNPILGVVRLSGSGQRDTVLDQPEQYARLFATMDAMVARGALRPAVRAFVVLLAATGLRRNEARLLTWADVDLDARRVVVRGAKGAKLSRSGPSIETVSLPPLAVVSLASIRDPDAADSTLVFAPSRGRFLAVNADWRRIVAEADLPPELVLHSLRHSLGTSGILAGMSTVEVSKMLRHRNIAVTQRYVHLAEASQSRLQDRASERLFSDAASATDVVSLSARERGR